MPTTDQSQGGAAAIGRFLLVERERAKEIVRPKVAPVIEPRRQDSDNFVRFAIHANDAADDVVRGAAALLPATIAENDHVIAAADTLARKKVAPELWLDTKN